MQLSNTSQYAIRILAYIANKKDSELINAIEVAKTLDISYKFLTKIMTELVKADLVESIRGRNGGFKLKKSSSEIMVNDILNGVKSELTTYQGVISEAENMQLRQTIQQIRNNDESFQYELFKIAQAKGYYKPAQPATVTEIQTVKTELQQ